MGCCQNNMQENKESTNCMQNLLNKLLNEKDLSSNQEEIEQKKEISITSDESNEDENQSSSLSDLENFKSSHKKSITQESNSRIESKANMSEIFSYEQSSDANFRDRRYSAQVVQYRKNQRQLRQRSSERYINDKQFQQQKTVQESFQEQTESQSQISNEEEDQEGKRPRQKSENRPPKEVLITELEQFSFAFSRSSSQIWQDKYEHDTKLRNCPYLSLKSQDFVKEGKYGIQNEYNLIQKIGKGNYGVVYAVVHKISGKERAIKILRNEEGKNSDIFQEIDVLKSMDHPHIIHIYEYFIDSNYIYLSTELCQKGDLYRYTLQKVRLKEEDACLFIYQLLTALAHAHSKGVVHRDVKPQNILFSKTLNNDYKSIKLVDFGLSRITKHKQGLKGFYGTPKFLAPEILNGKYGEKCDI